MTFRVLQCYYWYGIYGSCLTYVQTVLQSRNESCSKLWVKVPPKLMLSQHHIPNGVTRMTNSQTLES
jgi:hypothetical protein